MTGITVELIVCKNASNNKWLSWFCVLISLIFENQKRFFDTKFYTTLSVYCSKIFNGIVFSFIFELARHHSLFLVQFETHNITLILFCFIHYMYGFWTLFNLFVAAQSCLSSLFLNFVYHHTCHAQSSIKQTKFFLFLISYI